MEYRFTIINGEVETVIDEPIGWDKCKFTLARDENYHGIFVTFSTDLEFVGTGYTIISDTFYNEGIEAILTLRIEERCNASYDYSEVFEGRINLSRFQDLFNGYCSCKANLEDSTSQMLIKNNADKLIDLTGVSENTMTMHSKAIVLTSVFDTVDESVPLDSSVTTVIVETYFLSLPTYVKSNDLKVGENTGINSQLMVNPVNNVAFVEPSFIPAYTGTYTLYFNAKGYWSDFSTFLRTYNIEFAYKINSDPNLVIFDIGSITGLANTTVTPTFDISNLSFTLNLVAGDVVKIFFIVANYDGSSVGSVSQFALFFETCNIYFKSQTTTSESTAKTYLIHEAFEKVSNETLGTSYSFDSNFFGRKDLGYGSNGCGSFTAITNGFNIRAFNKPVITSLSNLFNSFSAIHCLGLGLENNKIKVEPLDYFYDQNTEIIQHLNIKQISVSSNESLIYNTAVIGFEKSGTEDGTDKENVLDGFATQHNYNFPITTIKKVFSKISTFIADHYSIEFTRRVQYINTSTSSWKYDNDNFVICTNRTENAQGYTTSLNIAEKNENFAVTNNIISPETGYNLRLTPTRMLLKWNQLISGVYSKTVGNSIKFVNGISNYLYQSQLNGNCTDRYNNQLLSENQNLSWDDANNEQNAPIIEPISVKYTYPMTSTEFTNIVSNPNGYISASKSGTIENRGFIKMLTFTPTEGMADIELIRMFGNESQCDLVYVECPYVESEYVE